MKKSLGAKTLVYPTPVFVVGTYDKEWRANAMTVAWGGICCSQPPLVTISVRKATYTYGNLMERGAFTIHIPSEDQVAVADYFGTASGRNEDKLANAGISATKSEKVDAPILSEFPLVLECQLRHAYEIGLHTQFIGEIMDVKMDESLLDGNGASSIAQVRPFLYAPDDRCYYGIGKKLAAAFTHKSGPAKK